MSESRHRMTGRYPARSAHGPATPGGALAICRSRLMRAAVAGFILFLFAAACSTAGAQGTRAECEAAGGKWGRFGLRQRELCDLPAPDAGKACTDSKDCASACVAPDAAPVAQHRRRGSATAACSCSAPASSRCAAAWWRLRCALTEPIRSLAVDSARPARQARRMPVRAVLFDAGHTLLEMDYAAVTSALAARGHAVTQEAVTAAERRARIRLDHEQAAQPTRARTGGGRYVRYLLEALGITDTGEQRAVAEWRRAFNLPVGLCHRADAEAVDALQRVRAAGLATGVISNSNGSVRFALEQAGLAAHLDFIIDSTVVGIAKPDPRVFHLGLQEAGAAPAEAVYVGDSYFVDVLGAREVGMGAVLFDPGQLWGPRDCRVADGLGAAVSLALSARADR